MGLIRPTFFLFDFAATACHFLYLEDKGTSGGLELVILERTRWKKIQ